MNGIPSDSYFILRPPSLEMSSPHDKSSSRPTLPPIRDLFRDELAQQPNHAVESPHVILNRLRVHDDSSNTGPSSSSSHSQHSYGRRCSDPTSNVWVASQSQRSFATDNLPAALPRFPRRPFDVWTQSSSSPCHIYSEWA